METKKYKKIFAVLFLAVVIGFSICNLIWERNDILAESKELDIFEYENNTQNFATQMDKVLSENLAGGSYLNEVYSFAYKTLGKNEANSFKVVRDKNGCLYSANFWNTSNVDTKELALRVRRLQDAVADKGTKVVCIMYPTKYNDEHEITRYFDFLFIDSKEFWSTENWKLKIADTIADGVVYAIIPESKEDIAKIAKKISSESYSDILHTGSGIQAEEEKDRTLDSIGRCCCSGWNIFPWHR